MTCHVYGLTIGVTVPGLRDAEGGPHGGQDEAGPAHQHQGGEVRLCLLLGGGQEQHLADQSLNIPVSPLQRVQRGTARQLRELRL